VLTQLVTYRAKLETGAELLVICVFHLLGLGMELYKVALGSWSYPEVAITKLAGVPLYSGFMYASVASYMCQAWHRLDLRMEHWPTPWLTLPLGAATYLNFFTLHVIGDWRWLLLALIGILFWRTRVSYRVRERRYLMPILLAFFLIAAFIWLGENIATYFGAWAYPEQLHGWRFVGFGKLSSWFLLVVVSLAIVVAAGNFTKKRLFSTCISAQSLLD
jgi:uncharacterized membrane protein YoaT (DUF817 family)